jgi:hypothetical protein
LSGALLLRAASSCCHALLLAMVYQRTRLRTREGTGWLAACLPCDRFVPPLPPVVARRPGAAAPGAAASGLPQPGRRAPALRIGAAQAGAGPRPHAHRAHAVSEGAEEEEERMSPHSCRLPSCHGVPLWCLWRLWRLTSARTRMLQRWREAARRRRGLAAAVAAEAALVLALVLRAAHGRCPVRAAWAVSRPFPSWTRSILTEIYRCHPCSCHTEILRILMMMGTPGQAAPLPGAAQGSRLLRHRAGGAAAHSRQLQLRRPRPQRRRQHARRCVGPY